MRGRVWIATAVLAMTVTAAVRASAQDAKTVIAEASRAMGVAGLESITVLGGGGQGNFGQSRTITFGIASTLYANYARTYDFSTATARFTADTTPPTPRGGVAP